MAPRLKFRRKPKTQEPMAFANIITDKILNHLSTINLKAYSLWFIPSWIVYMSYMVGLLSQYWTANFLYGAACLFCTYASGWLNSFPIKYFQSKGFGIVTRTDKLFACSAVWIFLYWMMRITILTDAFILVILHTVALVCREVFRGNLDTILWQGSKILKYQMIAGGTICCVILLETFGPSLTPVAHILLYLQCLGWIGFEAYNKTISLELMSGYLHIITQLLLSSWTGTTAISFDFIVLGYLNHFLACVLEPWLTRTISPSQLSLVAIVLLHTIWPNALFWGLIMELFIFANLIASLNLGNLASMLAFST